jgi:hypothetical protein
VAPTESRPVAEQRPHLARELNAFDATLIVMGGIIGTGIFVNPSVVAARAHTAPLILAAWIVGGIVALFGGFVFAELAARRPEVGGLYAYMRNAFHPVVAFSYGWTALLVSQSGGIALAAITFALYFNPLALWHAPAIASAVGIIVLFSVINCFGVKEGGITQNLFMVLKIAVILALIVAGFIVTPAGVPVAAVPAPVVGLGMFALLGSAMIPVLYAYDGWQTASFMSGELKNPRRTLSYGLVIGVLAVIVLYVAVTIVCIRVLGPDKLALSSAPATDIMHLAGPAWEWIIAMGVGLSTLGFFEQPDSHVAAHLLCDGGGRRFLRQPRLAAPKDGCADRRDRAAGGRSYRDYACRSRLRSAAPGVSIDSRRRCRHRFFVLCTGRARGLRVSQTRSFRRRRCHRSSRTSLYDGDLRPRMCRSRRLLDGRLSQGHATLRRRACQQRSRLLALAMLQKTQSGV